MTLVPRLFAALALGCALFGAVAQPAALKLGVGLFKPEYFALMITHPYSGIKTVADFKCKTFAFGDKGSTSGYLIPLHFFMTQGINPDTYFSKLLYTKHQAIETQVAAGQLDAGADYNRNRTAMIEQGLIKAERSVVIWQSSALPNDAFAVSEALYTDKAFVVRLQEALAGVGEQLKSQPGLLPPHYTGFVSKGNALPAATPACRCFIRCPCRRAASRRSC